MYRLVSLIAALALVACGDSDSSSSNNQGQSTGGTAANAGGTAANAGGGAAANAGGAAAAGKKVTVKYVAQNAQDQSIIAGAEICIDGAECVTTDANGVGEVELVVGSRINVSAKADTFFTARGSAIIPETQGSDFVLPLIKAAIIELIADKAEAPADPAKGHIAFVALVEGEEVPEEKAGLSITLNPNGGGVGPKYLKAGDLIELLTSDLYDDSLMATTSAGAANYFNLEPGEYTLTVTGAEGCNVFTGIAAGDGKIEFDVKAGEVTYVSYICPAP